MSATGTAEYRRWRPDAAPCFDREPPYSQVRDGAVHLYQRVEDHPSGPAVLVVSGGTVALLRAHREPGIDGTTRLEPIVRCTWIDRGPGTPERDADLFCGGIPALLSWAAGEAPSFYSGATGEGVEAGLGEWAPQALDLLEALSRGERVVAAAAAGDLARVLRAALLLDPGAAPLAAVTGGSGLPGVAYWTGCGFLVLDPRAPFPAVTDRARERARHLEELGPVAAIPERLGLRGASPYAALVESVRVEEAVRHHVQVDGADVVLHVAPPGGGGVAADGAREREIRRVAERAAAAWRPFGERRPAPWVQDPPGTFTTVREGARFSIVLGREPTAAGLRTAIEWAGIREPELAAAVAPALGVEQARPWLPADEADWPAWAVDQLLASARQAARIALWRRLREGEVRGRVARAVLDAATDVSEVPVSLLFAWDREGLRRRDRDLHDALELLGTQGVSPPVEALSAIGEEFWLGICPRLVAASTPGDERDRWVRRLKGVAEGWRGTLPEDAARTLADHGGPDVLSRLFTRLHAVIPHHRAVRGRILEKYMGSPSPAYEADLPAPSLPALREALELPRGQPPSGPLPREGRAAVAFWRYVALRGGGDAGAAPGGDDRARELVPEMTRDPGVRSVLADWCSGGAPRTVLADLWCGSPDVLGRCPLPERWDLLVREVVRERRLPEVQGSRAWDDVRGTAQWWIAASAFRDKAFADPRGSARRLVEDVDLRDRIMPALGWDLLRLRRGWRRVLRGFLAEWGPGEWREVAVGIPPHARLDWIEESAGEYDLSAATTEGTRNMGERMRIHSLWPKGRGGVQGGDVLVLRAVGGQHYVMFPAPKEGAPDLSSLPDAPTDEDVRAVLGATQGSYAYFEERARHLDPRGALAAGSGHLLAFGPHVRVAYHGADVPAWLQDLSRVEDVETVERVLLAAAMRQPVEIAVGRGGGSSGGAARWRAILPDPEGWRRIRETWGGPVAGLGLFTALALAALWWTGRLPWQGGGDERVGAGGISETETGDPGTSGDGAGNAPDLDPACEDLNGAGFPVAARLCQGILAGDEPGELARLLRRVHADAAEGGGDPERAVRPMIGLLGRHLVRSVGVEARDCKGFQGAKGRASASYEADTGGIGGSGPEFERHFAACLRDGGIVAVPHADRAEGDLLGELVEEVLAPGGATAPRIPPHSTLLEEAGLVSAPAPAGRGGTSRKPPRPQQREAARPARGGDGVSPDGGEKDGAGGPAGEGPGSGGPGRDARGTGATPAPGEGAAGGGDGGGTPAPGGAQPAGGT